MLLVGSFEPFDEAEARRVGANDTLTKPFQSIRSLIDKVGALVSGRAPEEQIATAELPKPDVEAQEDSEPEAERLSEAELNFVTADTQPLPSELRHMVEESAGRAAAPTEKFPETVTKVDEGERETETSGGSYEAEKAESEAGGAGDALLDLGGLPGAASSEAGDFVLDIDLDEAPDESAYQPSAYVRRPTPKSPPRSWQTSQALSSNIATADQLASTQEFPAPVSEAARASQAANASHAVSGVGTASPEGFSPEVIDAIARRAVEHMSEKVVREIAWEVVPDLAELLIKRQLEENKM